jgi:hypothetical protein
LILKTVFSEPLGALLIMATLSSNSTIVLSEQHQKTAVTPCAGIDKEVALGLHGDDVTGYLTGYKLVVVVT